MYPEYPVENWFAKWLRDTGNLSRTMDELYQHGLPKSGD